MTMTLGKKREQAMKAQKGFTLIELLVTLTVVAILAGIAVPSFSSAIRNNRVATVTEELRGALQLARAEAVKRRVNVLICRRNSAGTDCENGTDWSTGWLIRLSNAPNDIIKVWDATQAMNVTGPNAGLTFRANGFATSGTFSATPSGCTEQQSRTLAVTATGNLTQTKVSCP